MNKRLVTGSLVGLSAVSLMLLAGDLDRERGRARAMLEAVSKTIEQNFYDPSLKKLDWAALSQETETRIRSANSMGEMFTAVYRQVDKLQDSHTKFIPPPRVSRHLFGFEARSFGDEVLINELDEKGAAAQAGLRKGDRILTINGFAAERNTLDLMMLYFRILQPASTLEIEFSREKGPVQMLRLEGKRKDGLAVTDLTRIDTIYQLIRESQSERELFLHEVYEDGRVGYLYLPTMTAERNFFSKLIEKVKKAPVVVIDVRGNRGGAVESLEHFIGFFESQPLEVASMLERKQAKPLKARPQNQELKVPLVILVDSQSSSAAEVLARHFQRTGRALVIGDRTSGRVSVAKVFPHKIGTDVVVSFGVQVAIARLQFPGGEELEGIGVQPDVFCTPSSADLAEGNDPCLKLGISKALERIS